MKLFKILALGLSLSITAANASALTTSALSIKLTNMPDKTICLKHPQAANTDKFFSSTTMLSFEIYKPGNTDFVKAVIASLKSDPNVQSVTEGAVTGDFYAVTISLKSAQSKQWFINSFKKAKLANIKINNNEVVSVDKM
ncbi:MAG: hypothetical protein ACK5QC_06765 [Bacteroidota bacterium]|jgi:hypothetical protein